MSVVDGLSRLGDARGINFPAHWEYRKKGRNCHTTVLTVTPKEMPWICSPPAAATLFHGSCMVSHPALVYRSTRFLPKIGIFEDKFESVESLK